MKNPNKYKQILAKEIHFTMIMYIPLVLLIGILIYLLTMNIPNDASRYFLSFAPFIYLLIMGMTGIIGKATYAGSSRIPIDKKLFMILKARDTEQFEKSYFNYKNYPFIFRGPVIQTVVAVGWIFLLIINAKQFL